MRDTFARWRDRLTLALIVAAALSYLRHMAPLMTGWGLVGVAIGSGVIAGLTARRAIGWRLTFHAGETPFAADALEPKAARGYMMAWLVAALVISACVFAMLSWRALPLFVPSFALGAGLATLFPEERRPSPMALVDVAALRWFRPIFAVHLAIILWLALDRLAGADRAIVVTLLLLAGIELLAPLDAGLLRFEGLSGIGVMSSLRRHLWPATLWYGVAAAIASLQGTRFGVSDTFPFAVAAGGLAVALARLLAYRVTSRRTANLIVAGILILCGLVAGLSPGWEWLAAPIALIGIGGLLARAVRERWMMP